MTETARQAISVVAEVKKVIVGKDAILAKVLMAILAGGHILLEDIPGVGKTTMALGFPERWDWNMAGYSLRPMSCRRI